MVGQVINVVDVKVANKFILGIHNQLCAEIPNSSAGDAGGGMVKLSVCLRRLLIINTACATLDGVAKPATSFLSFLAS